MNRRISAIAIPAGIVGIVVMMVVPIPTLLLDLLLTMSIAGSVVILLAAMLTPRALDLSSFPALLLVATVFRLALNVSSTRLALLHAHAGSVIEAFGNFVVGGNLVVGLVLFFILFVIQFIVITKGSERVAEVSARFTLDALPGKQMAIDADLNAGLIDENQARVRRAEVAAEADFHGSMDGASKFVKGDAIAGVIITIINLLGGFAIGVLQKGMPMGEAAQTYSLLTVGDGLVSQIPALLISVGAGLLVTRAVGSENGMGGDLATQFGRQTLPLRVGAAIVAVLAIIPGLPTMPFLAVAAILWFASRKAAQADAQDIVDSETAVADAAEAATPSVDSVESITADMRVEPVQLELAVDLVELANAASGGDLLDRVRALRRKIAMELGVIIPLVRTRDSLELDSETYSVKIHGVEQGRGILPAGHVLAIGDGLDSIPGTPGIDPVFGLPARWIPESYRFQAEVAGATVVDRASVITTHLSEILRANAGALLSRQDVKALVETVKDAAPAVIEDLTQAQVTYSEMQRVLRDLLDEGVPITDLIRIFEAVTERARVSKDPEHLVEAVRSTLGSAIAALHAVDGRLAMVSLDPMLEHALAESLRLSESGLYLALDPAMAERVALGIAQCVTDAEAAGERPVLVCAVQLRPALRRLVRPLLPRLAVLSYGELGGPLEFESVGVVSAESMVAS